MSLADLAVGRSQNPATPLRRRARRLASFGLSLVLVSSVLVAVTTTPASAAEPCGSGGNQITCENSQPGTPDSVWDISGAGDPSIQGFATDISVNVGNRIDFKVDTDARNYTIDIYRTGWYQGLGARKVASVAPSATLPQSQPQCISDATTELYDCGTWAVSASWNVPATAVSGVYFALLTRTDTGGRSHITFIVRDVTSHSQVLFQTSDPTWEAYNSYGGSDFYQGAANGRAYKISYNRPFATRGGSTNHDFYFSNEYPAVRFLEKNGYDVSYFSGVDTDRFGSTLVNHKVFLSVGHDEYWSAGQRSNVEAARDAGVNLQFLSGNEVYWHTRYENSVDPSATPYRTLVCYKETWSNSKIDPSAEWTGTWRDPRFASPANGAGNPENGLTGTQYMSNFSDLAVTVSATEGKMRLWRNTSLASLATGSSAVLAPHTVGYESDEDVDNGFRPDGLIRLSTTTGAVPQYLQDFGNVVQPGTTTHHVTLYRAASGALVFSAGSIQWSWGLDQDHDGNGAAADPRMQQAQVNLLADMGAQPVSLASPLVLASPSTDHTAPVASISTPAAGATVPNGSSVTVSGTATDAGGQVAGVEVSTDSGATWHAATGTTTWSYRYVQQGYGTASVQVRAIDDSGNYAPTPVSRSVTVAGPYSVFGVEQPTTADAGDPTALELGLRFTPTTNGFVGGVRFFKSTANTGTHTGSLWDSAGTRLATVTFSGESASGWQTASFTSAVAVTAGQTYVVSYSTPGGHYSAADYYWSYRGRDAGPLKVAGGFGTQPAGVYGNVGVFPTQSYHQGNYYVDAVFTDSDNAPLTAINQSPQPGSSSAATTTVISAVMSKAITASSLAFAVKDAQGTAVSGTTAYDSNTRTATFTPSAALRTATTYTVTISATDTSGGQITAGQSWSFTTAPASNPEGVCPCSLFDASATPSILEDSDSSAVTLGVRFTAQTAGTVTAVKFYKGPNNTGTHVGSLWSGSGALLASATFAAESASGWQTVNFATPVAISAGVEYTASYRTTVGKYSATLGTFSGPYTRGPLSVPANGGSYSYANGYPNTQVATNYSVDLVFQPSTTAITVVSRTPSAGATGVSPSAPVSITLSTAVADGYRMTASAAGTAIAGSTSLSTDRSTITFVPTQPFPTSTKIDMTVSNVTSSSGTALPTQTWSFTTAASAPAVTEYSLLTGLTPEVTSAGDDPNPVELGMSFSTSVSGSATGVKFFKGSGNTGTHTGSLWSSAGQRLATATFTQETASGWQSATFATPVALTPGQTYIVSYFAPAGHYSYTTNFFATARSSGPLTAGSSANGRYTYASSGGFPTSTWQASNYFVDVVVSTASGTTPPPAVTVTSTTPAAGATGVSPTTGISAQLSGTPSATPTLAVSSAGTVVSGTSSYNSTSRVVTFAPAAALAASTQYSATVSVSGTALSGGTWTFTTAATAPAPVTVTSTTPAAGATAVDPTLSISAQLSGDSSSGTPTLVLRSASGQVAGTVAYDSSARVVRFTPAQPLGWSTQYTATVSIAGTTLSGGSWSFTTAAEPPTVSAQTIFSAGAVPANPAWDDPNAVQVGVRFSSSSAGTITGIRFYKGTQNTGTHQGYLWSSTGSLLATVTFTGETASGWQSATFSTPVQIQPGVEYRASYHSSVGWYAVTAGGLASPVVNGALSTPANGGVYLYGTAYPSNVVSHNYWVDVFFVPAK
ncbi:hypothetical protein GCM10027052_24430 [Parafrigoribacterium mesophilum]|uniref:DUF4082 domain-containing protein n=1 Tax=Parafrigoribacterium mesophilum TaxID=433646 RepID=UPI0031FD0AD2